MKQVTFDKVKLSGFWGKRLEVNQKSTIPNIYKRFSETGRFDALKCEWKEGMPNKPHIFWDSDVAKWIESVAFAIRTQPDESLEVLVDAAVDEIEAHQWEDGYFNSYYTAVEPENRFTNRDNHELYCAGHMLEAAIAYDQATGKNKLLNVMIKYLDYINQRFIVENSASFNTPGHEEIELALMKLYDHTGNKKYFEMAQYFIETRGKGAKEQNNTRNWIDDSYDQSDYPVRELPAAVGHSVRAMYLYCGMADLALETGDKTLFDACDRLFDSAAGKRMYITGGIGSASHAEQFANDYFLPNDTAYSETCASIGLAYFARRMSKIKADSKYDDVAELAIYNCGLAGVSLDGKSFFYVNPLEINMARYASQKKYCNTRENLLTHRIEVFDCSCCPPNLSRMIASIGDFLYTYDDTTVYAHHFMESETKFEGIKIKQQTRYPSFGDVRFTVSGMKGKTFAVRIPGWSTYTSLGGEKLTAELKDGFVYLDVTEDEQVFDFYFEMKPRLIAANPNVDANAGRVCICRGPIVYCAESVLNDGVKLNNLSLKVPLEAGTQWDEEIYGLTINAAGYEDTGFDRLYKEYSPEDKKEKEINFLPYYAFANNGESDMLIWFRYN